MDTLRNTNKICHGRIYITSAMKILHSFHNIKIIQVEVFYVAWNFKKTKISATNCHEYCIKMTSNRT